MCERGNFVQRLIVEACTNCLAAIGRHGGCLFGIRNGGAIATAQADGEDHDAAFSRFFCRRATTARQVFSVRDQDDGFMSTTFGLEGAHGFPYRLADVGFAGRRGIRTGTLQRLPEVGVVRC